MEYIENGIKTLNDFLWGWPLIGLLLGTHLFLTVRTKGIQRFVFRGIRLSVHSHCHRRTGSGILVLADRRFRDGDNLW